LLFVIGIDWIVVLDCLTYGASIVALLLVQIPRTRQADAAAGAGVAALLADFRKACQYVAARRGLLGLLIFLAALEFCAGFVDILIAPMILAFASSAAVGSVLSIGGIGMAATSVAIMAWGGFRRRVRAILGFTLLLAAATIVGSLRPNLVLLAAAAFVFMGGLAIVIGSNRSLWQAKVELHLLGRVMALQNMVAAVAQLCAFASAGIIADSLFVPLAGRDRVRSHVLAMMIGNGPGRGFALLIMVMAVLLAVCAILAYLYPPLRHLDAEVPDASLDITPPARHTGRSAAPAEQ
jgi:hypothetical protein